MTRIYKTKNHASMIISRPDHMNMYTNPWLDHDTTNKIKKLTIFCTIQNKLEAKVEVQWYYGIKWNKERDHKESPTRRLKYNEYVELKCTITLYVYLNSRNKIIINIYPWFKIGLNAHVLFKVSFKMQSLTNLWDFCWMPSMYTTYKNSLYIGPNKLFFNCD